MASALLSLPSWLASSRSAWSCCTHAAHEVRRLVHTLAVVRPGGVTRKAAAEREVAARSAR